MKNTTFCKTVSVLTLCIAIVLTFYTCGSSKSTTDSKDYITTGPMVSYEKDISPIMSRSCAPCHFPDGNKAPLSTYENVKADVDDILKRVQLDESNMRFMPFKSKKPSLSQDEINMLKRWAGQGFAQ